ncbi:MAG: tripartite tricarboxylate transporter substrate binding protein [Methylobacteriaceae bacterium]|nr:tripartite tricarboxylate transporter substrate binding protein [Methylobacteriaceae bacterium]
MNKYMVALSAALLAGTLSANAQDAGKFDKDIMLVMPFSPGASIDVYAQKFKQVGEKYLGGKKINIEYKPGGSTSVGMNYMLSRPHDGYTVILNGNSTEFGVATEQSEGYTENDYIGLCNLASEQAVVFVNSESPFNSLGDFLEAARKEPGKYKWGGGSTMSQNHFFPLQTMAIAGVEFDYIPYENGGEVMLAILGKNIDIGGISSSAAIPYRKEGKIKILAQGLDTRAADLPDVPTAYETPGLDIAKYGFPYWSTRSIDAPADVPEAMLVEWDKLIKAIVNDQEWIDFMKSRGVPLDTFKARKEATDYIRSSTANLREVYQKMMK